MSELLLIGPRTNKKDPSKTGGVIVLFENLIEELQQKNIFFIVVDTNKANYSNIVVALLMIYFKIFTSAFRANHLSLHGTAKDYVYIAPLVVVLSKLLGKKSSTRKFAGNFNHYYAQTDWLKKKIIEYVLTNSDFNFFETKYLVNFFKTFNPNTFWFPNVRKKSLTHRGGKFQNKFIFVGNITGEKGIKELLEASNLLDDSFVIDIYGNIAKDLQDCDFTMYKAEYKGVLRSENVLNTLCQYDVLILPSYREGYPGVIIEALSVGLPVIVSDLEGIREMVDDRCAFFVKPGNSTDIVNSIMKFNSENYESYSINALKAFEQFDSDVQTEIFFQNIGLKC